MRKYFWMFNRRRPKWLSADFIFKRVNESSIYPLERFWTLGWKCTAIEAKFPNKQYGSWLVGREFVDFDQNLQTYYSIMLTHAMNVAYELGREDENPLLRWWRNRRRNRVPEGVREYTHEHPDVWE